MANLFKDKAEFNDDIGIWEVQNVTSMQEMFRNATKFNQNISSWSVQNVTSMESILYLAESFNQDITSWDVSNLENMSYMFYYTLFNQDIGSWNVSNVTNFSYMFKNSAFNQDLSGNFLTTMEAGKNIIDMFAGSTLANNAQLVRIIAPALIAKGYNTSEAGLSPAVECPSVAKN